MRLSVEGVCTESLGSFYISACLWYINFNKLLTLRRWGGTTILKISDMAYETIVQTAALLCRAEYVIEYF